MRIRRWGAALLAGLWVAGVGLVEPVRAQAAGNAPPPVETFYRNADVDDVKLSPSGRYLAMSSAVGERVVLAVFDLKNPDKMKAVARFNDADIYEFCWVNDDYLVYTIKDNTAGGGDQGYGPGLFSVKADGSEPRQLVKVRDELVTGRSMRELLDPYHRLLAVPENGGTEVIVGRYRFDAQGDVSEIVPIRVDVTTGRTRSLAIGTPANARNWWFDPSGEPRVASVTREGRTTLHWRAPGQDAWKVLAEFPELEEPFSPVEVDGAGQLFVTTTRGSNGYAVLKRFDFATGQPQDATLVSTPGFDFDGELVTAYGGSGAALGVRARTDAETTHWFDARLKKLQETVDKRFPGRVNHLTCGRCNPDETTALVHSWSDREPGQLWVYHASQDRWQGVGRVRGDVDPKRMATLDLHRIKARDGLELPVWVTLPPGTTKASRRPAVVLVHGGPWVRGTRWGWNDDAQFLASRGYVVIEPEFRGSTGYGDAHFRAGWKQWGLAMQDDVADALNWAVGQGWVDAKRACIAGASYGGYAVLAGLARHPELYRCGVAWVAVSDPRLLFESSYMNDMPEEAKRHSIRTLIGDPDKDAAALAAVAPVEQAARIKAPLLLAYGGRDTRVPLVHGEKMRAALRAAGQDPEWVVYPEEWHGWHRAANRYDFARRLEKFLATHLGATP